MNEISLLEGGSDSEEELSNLELSHTSPNVLRISANDLDKSRNTPCLRNSPSPRALSAGLRSGKKAILSKIASSPLFKGISSDQDPKVRVLKKNYFLNSSIQDNSQRSNFGHPPKSFNRALFRHATDGAFKPSDLHVTFAPNDLNSSKMTGGNTGSNGQETSFPQTVALHADSPLGQSIELSTLKFADSPSLDGSLKDWYILSAPSVTSASSSTVQSPPSKESIGFQTREEIGANSFRPPVNGPLVLDSACCNINTDSLGGCKSVTQILANDQQCSELVDTEKTSFPGNGWSNSMGIDAFDHAGAHDSGFGSNCHHQQQQHQHDQHPANQAHHHHHHPHHHHHHSYGQPASSTWDSNQPKQVMGDRRLPDFVTIDQCYRESDDNDCSTICLVANLENGKKDEFGVEVQGLIPKRQVPDKKERASLRRGIMMRQMSMNPGHDQDTSHSHTYDPKYGDPVSRRDEEQDMSQWESEQANSNAMQRSPRRSIPGYHNNNNTINSSNNNNNNNNEQVYSRTCSDGRHSFSKHPAPHPCVVVEPEIMASRDGHEAVSKEATENDDRRNSSCVCATQQASPSSGRMKMKHLGLASPSSSAHRFRLTFDESADAAANTPLELPQDVTPHVLASKRPSCICGEPELPAEYLSQFHESDSTCFRNDQSPLITKSLGNPSSSYPSDGTAPPEICLQDAQDNSSVLHTLTQAGYSEIDDQMFSNNVDENSSAAKVQTQMDNHPRITIRISNSQQSFSPFSCESPTGGGESGNDRCESHLIGPNAIDLDGDMGDCTPSPYADGSYLYHSQSAMSDCYSTLPGLSEEMHLLSHHQDYHHDTVQAPPIQDLYRYHVFFSHCPEDREWVEHMVAHLEGPPFNYTCAYASIQDEVDQSTLQQRILCAAMLSERVVLVLSSRYVQDTWFSFEKTLKQLTQMSLHNQRIMGVLLEDCHIPDSLGELYFLDSSDPDFFHVFTKRLKTSRIPRSSASVSSDLGQSALAPANVTNGKILTFCRLQVKVGWNSYLIPADGQDLDIPPSLSAHGIGMEKTEFGEIVTTVSGIVNGSNKLPWLLSARPLAALLMAGGLWIPAFIAVLVIHVDDDSGIALPIRLAVFLYPLGLVAAGYLMKWRRSYWLTKIVRLLVQNCIDVNQALYFQGRPLFTTAAHVRANIFAVYFVYFDATDCVRSVDLLLFTCMEDDWDKLIRLISFYTRDENYLSRIPSWFHWKMAESGFCCMGSIIGKEGEMEDNMSISERLTVMMSAPYLVKLVRQVLPHPPQQRHVSRLLCLCQFTEECISRFAHGLDREDVPGLAELFTRHMPGKVSGSAVRRVQEELFHANHGLVP